MGTVPKTTLTIIMAILLVIAFLLLIGWLFNKWMWEWSKDGREFQTLAREGPDGPTNQAAVDRELKRIYAEADRIKEEQMIKGNPMSEADEFDPDFNLDAIIKQMNEDHRILCEAANPDIYIYTIRTRKDGRLEANAECKSCMMSGISILKDRPEFHTNRNARV